MKEILLVFAVIGMSVLLSSLIPLMVHYEVQRLKAIETAYLTSIGV